MNAIQIYKNTLIKYFKSPTTWIILLVSCLITFFLGPYFVFNQFKSHTSSNSYIILTIAVISSTTIVSVVFISIFAGFKAATMIRDEIDNGVILTILSKPVKRRTIIVFKWLALQSIMFIYCLFTILSFATAIIIFDNGPNLEIVQNGTIKSLTANVVIISLYMFIILFCIGLFFSSIALILSTKLGVGTTIGITITIAICIELTSIIGVFTNKKTNVIKFNNSVSEILFLKEALKNNNKVINSPNGLIQFKKLFQEIDQYYEHTKTKNSIYDIVYLSEKKNNYKNYWFLDLSFHLNNIASYSYDIAIPSKIKEAVDTRKISSSNNNYWNKLENDPFNKTVNKKFDVRKKAFDQKLFNTLEKLESTRKEFFLIWFNSINSLISRLNKTQLENDDLYLMSKKYNQIIDFQINIDHLPLKLKTQLILKDFLYKNQKRFLVSLKGLSNLFMYYKNIFFVQNPLTKLLEFKDDKISFNNFLNYQNDGINYHWFFFLSQLLNTSEFIISNDKKPILELKNVFYSNYINNVNDVISDGLYYIYNSRRINNAHQRINNYRLTSFTNEQEKKYLKNNLDLNNNWVIYGDEKKSKKYYLSPREKNLYSWLIVFFLKNNHNLYKGEMKKYVNRETLVIFYSTVIVAILPIAYFLFKKYDFR